MIADFGSERLDLMTNLNEKEAYLIDALKKTLPLNCSGETVEKIKLVYKREGYIPDLIMTGNDGIYIFDIKFYRGYYVDVGLVNRAVDVLKRYETILNKNAKAREKIYLYLIILCHIDEDIKRDIFNTYNIIIWDIHNILFLLKTEDISKIVSYPTNEIDLIPPKIIPGQGPQYNKPTINIIEEKYDYFRKKLKECKPGKDHNYSNIFENICTEIIEYLFGSEFNKIKPQHLTEESIFRMDLICSLKGNAFFWKYLIQNFHTQFVVFEYKNYTAALDQNLIYVTEKYLFNAALRNVAIIVSRKGFSEHAVYAAKGCLKENGKLILDVKEKDLLEMVKMKDEGNEPSDYLQNLLEVFLMSISK